MDLTITNAFMVAAAALGALIVLGIATAVIYAYVKRKDLQEQLKRGRIRKQKEEKTKMRDAHGKR